MDTLSKEFDNDDNQRPKFLSALVSIILPSITTLLWVPVSATLLPFFLFGLFIWGLPPTIPVWSRILRYFTAVFTEGTLEDNIPFTNRVIIFVLLLNLVVKIPVNGVCWFVDELLYPAYHKVDIKEPVFFVTAPRSGSTQLAQYLEEDKENFVTPTIAEGMFPYIWFWRLIIPIFVKLGIINKQKNIDISYGFGKEAKKQHEYHLSKTDTWDNVVGAWHITMFSWCLGASFFNWGNSCAKLEEPIDDKFHDSFLFFTNHIMRKVMYLRGSPKHHMFVKGHFVVVAEELYKQYPDAKFFAVVREPVERIFSQVNLMKVVSADGPPFLVFGLFPPTWRVIRHHVVTTQIPYSKQEMAFYKDDQDNRLAIPFTTYVKNLCSTMQSVYAFCSIPIPDWVVSEAIKLQNTTHDRTKFKVDIDPKFDRSLKSLGVDEEKIKEHLAGYLGWIDELENSKKYN